MRAIHKYTLPIEHTRWLVLPEGAKFLSVQNQLETLTLWFEVDTQKEDEVRRFQVVVTGGEPPDSGTYLGTVQLAGGTFVAHVYETTSR